MAVVIETTLGDITVDLYLEQRPATCLNFLKLCKMKYYNFNLFHTIRSGFIAQTGDPTGEGSGGESIWGLLEGSSKRFFSGEKMPKIRHTDAGLLSMVCTDDMMIGSQFFFTLAPDLDSLDGVHCVIGEVTEGQEVLTKLNEVICDETHRPYQDVRITHTVVLDDPFNDLPGLRAPSRSPSPNAERLRGGRIAPDEEIDETQGKTHEEVQEMIDEKEAKARATILEIVGDLPDADIAPPENVLFVCKLNPVTTDDDLEIIFSRFGKIVSCEVIRDKKSGDSLQYAFIEFDDKKSCEDAYFKMDNVLIDDRRIHVDFSQSVSKMRWLGKGRGVQYFNEKESKLPETINSSRRSHSRERNDSRRQHYNRDLEQRDKNDRKKTYKNDKSYIDREREDDRSRSRRDRSHNRYSNNDKNHNGQNYSRTEKSHRNHDDISTIRNSSKHIDSYNKSKKSSKHSPTRNDKREYSRSPLRNNENKKRKHSDKEEKSNRNESKYHKSCRRDSRNEKKIAKDDNKTRKALKKTNTQETTEVEPHTPSPVLDKNKAKSKKSEKEKVKTIRNKKRRKPSTSSSDSETSDTSSSSSDSSSSSGQDKKKQLSKKKKRHQSSSSSSSSSSSTTSTSSSGSSSSTSSSNSNSSSSSTSDSDCDKKRHSKNGQRKKPKKL